MKFTPQILGAVAVIAIAGAVSGATIADTPMLTRGHPDTLPKAQIVSYDRQTTQWAKAPPNHYPLKTPNGTIEVAELALHGRMRDRGGDMWWERRDTERAQLNAEYDFYATASPERIAHERRLLAFTEGTSEPGATQAPASQPVSRAEAPMALADPVEVTVAEPRPAQSARVGNVKTINVSQALAAAN